MADVAKVGGAAEQITFGIGSELTPNGFARLGELTDEGVVRFKRLKNVAGNGDLNAGVRRRCTALETSASALPKVFKVLHVDGSQEVRHASACSGTMFAASPPSTMTP